MADVIGWDALDVPDPEDRRKPEQQKEDMARICAAVFSTPEGQKVMAWLRSRTIEQPSWYPGEDASHGFAREGQNSIVRQLEQMIEQGRKA